MISKRKKSTWEHAHAPFGLRGIGRRYCPSAEYTSLKTDWASSRSRVSEPVHKGFVEPIKIKVERQLDDIVARNGKGNVPLTGEALRWLQRPAHVRAARASHNFSVFSSKWYSMGGQADR